MYRLLGERYLPLIALTDSCASPVTSPRLRPWPSSRSLCRLLSAPAANRAFSTLFCESFLGCLVPYHGGPIGCSRLLLPRCHRPSPKRGELASRFFPRSRLFVGSFSRLQTFRYVQAPKFARLPDRAHRCGLAAGRPRLYTRAERASLPPHAPGMLAVRIQAIDGARTCTLPDSQSCRLLPLLVGADQVLTQPTRTFTFGLPAD